MPHLESENASNGFDNVSVIYSQVEQIVYGQAMQCAREAYIPPSPPPGEIQRILIIGEGPGRFLNHLLQEHGMSDGFEIHVVEKSAGMRKKIQFVLSDASHTVPVFLYSDLADACHRVEGAGGADWLVTHFFLDMYEGERLDSLVASLTDISRPGTRWLFADFCLPGAGPWWILWRARILLWIMYKFFRVMTGLKCQRLEDPVPAQIRHGWRVIREKKLNLNFISARELELPESG